MVDGESGSADEIHTSVDLSGLAAVSNVEYLTIEAGAVTSTSIPRPISSGVG